LQIFPLRVDRIARPRSVSSGRPLHCIGLRRVIDSIGHPDGRVVVPRNKDLIAGVPRGTVYRQLAGGGGGYGDATARDRTTLRREVRDGVISHAAARERYGLDDA
jgi:N-methylhydantoinase B/oxoprolinase/acetone carboxylase alpha subunit